VWGPAWKESHWSSIWLRARSHIGSHYTWGVVTTLHDLGVCWDGGLWTLFFRTLTISWSRLVACVWSGPRSHVYMAFIRGSSFFIAWSMVAEFARVILLTFCFATPQNSGAHINMSQHWLHCFHKFKPLEELHNTYVSLYSLIWDSAFWDSYKYKNMDKITQILKNIV
jgi:hypothetical protein